MNRNHQPQTCSVIDITINATVTPPREIHSASSSSTTPGLDAVGNSVSTFSPSTSLRSLSAPWALSSSATKAAMCSLREIYGKHIGIVRNVSCMFLTPRSSQQRVKLSVDLLGQTSYRAEVSRQRIPVEHGPTSDSVTVSTIRVGAPVSEGFIFDLYTEMDAFMIFPFGWPGTQSSSSCRTPKFRDLLSCCTPTEPSHTPPSPASPMRGILAAPNDSRASLSARRCLLGRVSARSSATTTKKRIIPREPRRYGRFFFRTWRPFPSLATSQTKNG